MPARVHAEAKAPHMAAVAVAAAAAGAAQIATGYMPSTIAAAASPAVGAVWSLLLILGGVTVLVGAFMRPVILGLRIEGSGHLGLAAGIIVYLLANVYWMNSPWWVSPAVWMPATVAIASLVRWFQIWLVFRSVRNV